MGSPFRTSNMMKAGDMTRVGAFGLALPQLFAEWWDYMVDAAQRTVLVGDVLRQRGNQYVEHVILGRPPVLTFNYETVMDGRTLPQPSNYLLLRIRPEDDVAVDPAKRPIVIFDPRAGHGPGIAGFKPDSQVGLALKHGYPCYFVSFLPFPVPGQTLEDVARTEAAFLRKVIELHPEAEDRPVIIGNCQAGWAVAILSAVEPELMSTVILNGAPLSYWSGEIGRDPMRYLGGLLGGTWLAALAIDLGHGLFDGANLVSNFESLDPANTLWKKPYNLYANVDTEAERFLGFELWWGGYFLLDRDEMLFITDELFVGNKLSSGEIVSSGGTQVNLRRIKAPVVVFCSKGDNITPPEQALNWILDVYQSTDDIRANGQVIVYLLHESIGHLGIFVSSKVAKREHRAIADNLDIISTLPPGLYEMEIGRSAKSDGWDVRFAKRELDDIRRLGTSRREEVFFVPVARVSEFNRRIYDSFVSPWMQLFGTELTAEMLRRANPNRLRRYAWSDMNPLMTAVASLADEVRRVRRPVPEDNVFRRAERANGDLIAAWLDGFRDSRDRMAETAFFATYAPLERMMEGEVKQMLEERFRTRADRERDAEDWLRRELPRQMRFGGVAEAVARILLYVVRRRPAVQADRFRLAEAALRRTGQFAKLGSSELRAILRDQFLLLMVDEDEAIATLPSLARSAEDRQAILNAVHSVAEEVGGFDAEQRGDIEDIERLLTVPAPAATTQEKPREEKTRAEEAPKGRSSKPAAEREHKRPLH